MSVYDRFNVVVRQQLIIQAKSTDKQNVEQGRTLYEFNSRFEILNQHIYFEVA